MRSGAAGANVAPRQRCESDVSRRDAGHAWKHPRRLGRRALQQASHQLQWLVRRPLLLLLGSVKGALLNPYGTKRAFSKVAHFVAEFAKCVPGKISRGCSDDANRSDTRTTPRSGVMKVQIVEDRDPLVPRPTCSRFAPICDMLRTCSRFLPASFDRQAVCAARCDPNGTDQRCVAHTVAVLGVENDSYGDRLAIHDDAEPRSIRRSLAILYQRRKDYYHRDRLWLPPIPSRQCGAAVVVRQTASPPQLRSKRLLARGAAVSSGTTAAPRSAAGARRPARPSVPLPLWTRVVHEP